MLNINLERMIHLAEEFFDAKSDPDQIAVDETVIEMLHVIHPNTMSEERDENGPVAWILVIPTTKELMMQFIERKINEKDILTRTMPGQVYEAVYLCSALVLPEYRKKGIAQRLTVGAITSIQKEHPIASLFYWSFSDEGERLARAIAQEINLPLFKRPAK
ncbi:MAG TPA: hypothetical protein VKI62_04350 [Bacteroidota bacterium]|nr:hypothetical protein [Bacteroidota bacterium]